MITPENNHTVQESREKPVRFGLRLKIILAVTAIWIPYSLLDVWFTARESRASSLSELQQWSLLTGETVRISLNTLMREGKMSERFDMFQNLTREIPVVKEFRMVRSPRVNEIFEEINQKKNIPRERNAIEDISAEIKDLEKDLAGSEDDDEKAEYAREIALRRELIDTAKANIERFEKKLVTDAREMPRDELDWKVLKSGNPEFVVEADIMRMVTPFKVQQAGCSETSGCHLYAKPGDVLGAVSMDFSIASINRQIRATALLNLLIQLGVGIVIITCLFLAVNHLVIRHIRTLRAVLSRLADGDLSVHLPENDHDEMGALSRSFNRVLARFRDVFHQIHETTRNVAHSADLLAVSAEDIVGGAEIQATRVHSVSQATDEVHVSSENVVVGIADVVASAQSAGQRAAQTTQSMINAANGMSTLAAANIESTEILQSLAGKADSISNIMQVVDDIAEQTNLLALNAAIEAARAGEHGRGFTIVSDEVRNLAHKTAAASREVAQIVMVIHSETGKALEKLQHEQNTAKLGLDLTQGARASISDIVARITEVTSLAGAIENAAREQQDATAKINEDISAAHVLTDQALVAARKVAAEAQALKDLLPPLAQAVNAFRL